MQTSFTIHNSQFTINNQQFTFTRHNSKTKCIVNNSQDKMPFSNSSQFTIHNSQFNKCKISLNFKSNTTSKMRDIVFHDCIPSFPGGDNIKWQLSLTSSFFGVFHSHKLFFQTPPLPCGLGELFFVQCCNSL